MLGQHDHVEFKPKVQESDGINMRSEPDYRINGDIWDCFRASETQDTRGIWDGVRDKVQNKKQTKRVVIDMTDSPVSLQDLSDEFAKFPMTGLVDLIIIALPK